MMESVTIKRDTFLHTGSTLQAARSCAGSLEGKERETSWPAWSLGSSRGVESCPVTGKQALKENHWLVREEWRSLKVILHSGNNFPVP